MHVPVRELSKEALQVILYGDSEREYKVDFKARTVRSRVLIQLLLKA